jgi:dihydrofolate reductase
MRRIINATYISLDGVVEAPHLWPSLGHGSDERGDKIQTELLLSCDGLLMGRHTYDGFPPVWPTRSGDPASDHINAMPKYVASTTLKDPADLLFGAVPTTIFRLVDTTALKNGIVILTYETEKQLT